jgi:hypothetical protein
VAHGPSTKGLFESGLPRSSQRDDRDLQARGRLRLCLPPHVQPAARRKVTQSSRLCTVVLGRAGIVDLIGGLMSLLHPDGRARRVRKVTTGVDAPRWSVDPLVGDRKEPDGISASPSSGALQHYLAAPVPQQPPSALVDARILGAHARIIWR